MVTLRALFPIALAALAGCLSTPPSGVISCNNTCPISGFYCANDHFCWMNGELPTRTSSSSTGGTAGSTGATGSTGASGGASSGHPTSGTGTTGGSTTGK